MSARVRVVVATTEGPSTVLRVTPEDPELRSVVCLGRTTTTLPISRAYDAFVRAPTGVVERAIGHPVFRTDVSAPIDDGESWQLGLYLAHRLKATGRLAENDGAADLVVWATGAVDGDLAVRNVEKVAEKRRRSEALFGAGIPVMAVVPAGQVETFGPPPDGVEVLAAVTVGDALRRLGLEVPAVQSKRRWSWLLAAAALAVLIAVVVARPAGLPYPEPDVAPTVSAPIPLSPTVPAPSVAPVFEPASVRLDLLERRPADAGSCGAGDRLEAVEPDAEARPGVCGIVVRAVNDGPTAGFVWLVALAEGAFREYAGKARSAGLASGPIGPGETVSAKVAAPAWVRKPVTFRILLVVADRERQQVSRALAAVENLDSGDLDRLGTQFTELGLAVRTVRHRVTPHP